jgi:hypothetical protein
VSIFTIIAKIIGLVPDAIDAGKAIARALRPTPTINPLDSTLWHSAHYGGGLISCSICGRYVDRQNEVCPEAVRRRTQN